MVTPNIVEKFKSAVMAVMLFLLACHPSFGGGSTEETGPGESPRLLYKKVEWIEKDPDVRGRWLLLESVTEAWTKESFESVVRAISDYEKFPQYFSYCEDAFLVRQAPEGNYENFTVAVKIFGKTIRTSLTVLVWMETGAGRSCVLHVRDGESGRNIRNSDARILIETRDFSGDEYTYINITETTELKEIVPFQYAAIDLFLKPVMTKLLNELVIAAGRYIL